jgi:hypothetical protein
MPNKFSATSYNPSNGFVAADATSTDVAITLSDHRYVMASFTDTEVATISLICYVACLLHL